MWSTSGCRQSAAPLTFYFLLQCHAAPRSCGQLGVNPLLIGGVLATLRVRPERVVRNRSLIHGAVLKVSCSASRCPFPTALCVCVAVCVSVWKCTGAPAVAAAIVAAAAGTFATQTGQILATVHLFSARPPQQHRLSIYLPVCLSVSFFLFVCRHATISPGAAASASRKMCCFL